MNASIRNRLSVMMFLEILIWGAWLPLIFEYMKMLEFTDFQKSMVMNAFAVSSLLAMFFSTQFADRNFAAERFLAFSHLVGGLAMLGMFFVTDFASFFALMLVHSLFYVPTLSITNSIAFTHLKDAQRDYGLVRLWGTIGWIAASWPLFLVLVDWSRIPVFNEVPFKDWMSAVLGTSLSGAAYRDGLRYMFVVAGAASLLLAAFSLLLPHTPPKPAVAGTPTFAFLEALKLLRTPFLFVLAVVTLIDASVHQCYFLWTGSFLKSEAVGIPPQWIMPVMSIGQFAEIVTMAALGLCLKRLGWRTTMIIGVLGHAVRFGVFALAPYPWLVVSINLLHGICYAFFFATVYIFVDEFFPKDARSSAQGLFNFLILGFGPLVGNFVWPQVSGYFKDAAGNEDYSRSFLVPAATSLVASVLLLLFFHPPAKSESA